jgi:anti-sigma B factor antagonist
MDSEPVTVESRDGKRPGQRVLKISGRLTFPTKGLGFLEQIRVETAPILILDLSGVSFCDSSGVGALTQIHLTFKRENRRLALAAINERVKSILEITRVLGYFAVFATVEEAEENLVQTGGPNGQRAGDDR